jgi:hypothetical protein
MTVAWLLRGLGAMAAAAVIGAGGIATGCNPQLEPTAQGCHLNSDCNEPLVCVDGECAEQCTSSEGCPVGQNCVLSEGGNACVLPAGEPDAAPGDAGDAVG